MKIERLLQRKNVVWLCLLLTFTVVTGLVLYIHTQKASRSNSHDVTDGTIDGEQLIAQYAHFTPSFILTDDLVTEDRLTDYAKEFETAPTLVLCQAAGWFRQVYDSSEQDIKVLKVLRGDNAIENTVVTCTIRSAFLFDNEIVARTFINFMNQEDTYLLALYPYGSIIDSVDGVRPTDVKRDGWFSMNYDYVCIQYLNLSEKANKLVETEETGTFGTTPYSELKNNEFFCTTENALSEITSFKHKMLAMYVPNEYRK